MAVEKEAIVKTPKKRPQRTKIEGRGVLTVKGKDPNYHYRVVNDIHDRVQDFIDNGWELCQANEVRVGDKRVETTSAIGANAEITVGRTVSQKAFVMRIPKEWWEEDQRYKEQEADAQEETMKRDPAGDYGNIKLSRD